VRAGFLAAADMAAVAGELDADYRLVGGMAVTLLVAAHGAAGLAPDRETADADFGAPAQVVADPRLVEALLRRGYVLHGGNRFRRQEGDSLLLAIDVLAPSQDHRMRSNQEYGALYVDEVPGLRLALARPGVSVEVNVSLMSGERLQIPLTLPDLVPAICMKAYAYQDRAKATDAHDLWRLLEAAQVAGLSVDDWPTGATGNDAAVRLRRHFGALGAHGLRDLGSDRARTRVVALVNDLVGPA